MQDDQQAKLSSEEYEQQEWLRVTLSSIGDAVMTTDTEGCVTFLNPVAQSLTGWTQEETAGVPLESVFQIVNEETRRTIENPAIRALHEGVVVGLANGTLLIAKDGTEKHIGGSAAPIRNAKGEVAGMALVFRDVTERRQAEEALLERELLARLNAEVSASLIENKALPEILQACAEAVVTHLDAAFARIWTLDETANVLELKASAGLYTHLDGEHSRVPVGKYKIGLIAAERRPHLTNSVVGDERVNNQEWAKREGMVAFAGYPLIIGDRLIGVVAMFARRQLGLDALKALESAANTIGLGIERKHAEELLRDSEEKFRDLANSISQFAWMADASGFIFWYNERWFEYTGTTLEEMQGWGWQKVHHPNEIERVTAKFKQHLASGEPWEDTFPLRSQADEYRWFLSRAVPIRDETGSIVRWFGTNTDIEEVRQARVEAEAANRLKDEFLATLSHELRTPLTSILGWTRLLQTGDFDAEKSKRALETIERNARAQNQLIDDLLDVSRIITGKLRLDVSPVELSMVIEAAVDVVRPAAEARNIRLRMLLDPSAGAVSGDANRLQQVVWNLLTNAVKFTLKGGQVEVRLERVNSHVEIAVSDTGQGIAPEFVPHVFDRFRQADQSATRTHGGLGLGLSIVRQLVEQHGGTVGVESEGVGQGTTFTIKLPRLVTVRRKEANETERVHPTSGGKIPFDCAPSLKGLRVLVVDDEPDTRELLRVALERCDSIVTTADSAAEALAAFAETKHDIIVCDIGMPEEDGYTLIGKVRALPAEQGGRTPAIALMAYARAEDRVRALMAGFQVHIPKPVEPVELAAVVASLAGRTGQV